MDMIGKVVNSGLKIRTEFEELVTQSKEDFEVILQKSDNRSSTKEIAQNCVGKIIEKISHTYEEIGKVPIKEEELKG